MYGVLKKARRFNLSIDCQLDLFDKIVVPILFYGSEVWGFGNLGVIEKVHLRFCKLISSLKQTTPNFIVYGELGRYPLSIIIKTRIVKYWTQLLTGKQTKYCVILYKLLLTKCFNSGITIFDECGMSNVFASQYFPNINWLVKSIKQRMLDEFLQNWQSSCNNSTKAFNYRLIVDFDFNCQTYLLSSLPFKRLNFLIKLRTSNHKLPVETGRWNDTPYANRNCTLCKSDLGDEYHYIMVCKAFSKVRSSLLPLHSYKNPNTVKYKQLLNSSNVTVLNNLCKFIKIVFERVSPPG